MAAAPLAASPLAAQADGWANQFALQLRDDFLNHWRNEREYTLAVLEAMPAPEFDLRPSPEQRTFGEQLDHFGRANTAYFAQLEKQIVHPRPEPPSITTKEPVRAYLAATFDYVEEVLQALTEEDFLRREVKFGGGRLAPHTTVDLFLRAYTHTAHHRGQIITYLRVTGIEPPEWRFTPNGS